MTARMTINQLFDAYVDHLSNTNTHVLRVRRSHLKAFREFMATDRPLQEFVEEFDDVVVRFRNSGRKRGTVTATLSTVKACLSWAYKDGHARLSHEVADRLEMPPLSVFATWSEHPKAVTVYKVLLAEMNIAGVTCEELNEAYFDQFLSRLPEHMVDWKGGWREFTKRWRAVAAEGEIPDIDLPRPPRKKRRDYRVNESDLPAALREEAALIRERLTGKKLSERQGRKPFDPTTIELIMGTLWRLIGFLEKERNLDTLALASLRDTLKLENGLALVTHTNRAWLMENGIPEAESKPLGIGIYELGQLSQLGVLALVGFQDETLYTAYNEECCYRRRKDQGRREKYKDFGHIDDYWKVACALVERARSGEWKNGGEASRAILLRDALLFALFASFAYRRSVMASIHLRRNIRSGSDGKTIICTRLEDTKPRKRDLQHEIPAEVQWLYDEYVQRSRPILLGASRDHQSLFVSSIGGRPMSDSAIYAQFVARCFEVSGCTHNCHQVRRAWASDYATYTSGDYLTASAVLDSSPRRLQKTYAKLDQAALINNYDKATRKNLAHYPTIGESPCMT